jgi:8-oxo-dGTP pyrophosphatase MutT (NUDIX family)
MNKKIYFGNKYILYGKSAEQTSEDQPFITINEGETKLIEIKKIVKAFLENTENRNVMVYGDDFNAFVKHLTEDLKYIGAAGGLIKREDSYLFIYRLGKWDLPKGKIEKGEKTKAAAVRECEEECGIRGLIIQEELPSTYHMYLYKKGFAIKRTYWYLMNTTFAGELTPQTEEHIEKTEWLDKAAIQQQVLPDTYPAIRELLVKALAL